jgi:tripartite-type tricarboxylate transporter receptor subunit TctC
MIDLRKVVLALALGAAATFVGGAAAQSYPTKPLTLIVPYAAGGTGDVVARVFSEKVRTILGQPLVVENRAGAGGAIGAQAAARSKPDGYTLMLMATAHVILPSLQQVPYDWERDFTPVFGVTATPLVFAVRAKSNIRSMADLAATAKSMSGGINYSSGGSGSISHLTAVRLAQGLKMTAVHVPYRGFSGAVQALLGDQVQFICATVADVIELTKSGDFRLLAVTSEKRVASLPDVPTMAELGFADFDAASWNAYLVPAKTPSDIVDRLYNAFAKTASDPGVQEQLAKLGVAVSAKNRPDLVKFIHDESVRWRRVVEENKIKIEN